MTPEPKPKRPNYAADRWAKKCAALEAKLAVAREVLGWYEDDFNTDPRGTHGERLYTHPTDYWAADRGARARAALQKLGEGGT